jgi:hypothetical protein
MTRFTLIVSTASKPLRGRLNHQVTMMGNQVMMMVIHTVGGDKSAPTVGAEYVVNLHYRPTCQ